MAKQSTVEQSTESVTPDADIDNIQGQGDESQAADSESIENVNEDVGNDSEKQLQSGQRELTDREIIALNHKNRRRQELGIEEREAEQNLDEDDESPSDEPEMITVKIGGQERQVLKSKVDEAGGVDLYQKRTYANESMAAAAEERKRIQAEKEALEREREEFKRWQEQQAQVTTESTTRSSDVDRNHGQETDNGTELSEAARKYHEAFLGNDDAAADKALIDLLNASRANPTQQIDENQIGKLAAERALDAIAERENQREMAKAYNMFKSEFSDIHDDPNLYVLADQKATELSREHPDWSPSKVMTEAGEAIREWKTGSRKKEQETRNNKREMKRSQATPRASNVRKTPPPPKPRQTRAGYVQQLRKNRGLD